jgi:Cu/Ag efflux protein CusF
MTIAKIVLATAAAAIIGSIALAQESQTTGRIMQIDQANGKITLQHMPAGTVGAAGARDIVDEYKMKEGLALNGLQAGDPVIFNEAQVGGVWTVTKIQKQ